jgi:rhodanese-related sulfurtransferase
LPTRITTEVLHQQLAGLEPPVLVEALGVGFYADAHLPGALNIPPGQVDAVAPTLLPDRAASIVVYCTGRCTSSDAVAGRLRELGYEHVAVYAGGKEDWVEKGFPLERCESEAG